MTRELSVHKAAEYHPISDPRGTVLMLPGRGYSCGMSLLAWTTRALHARSIEVQNLTRAPDLR
jgi:hypothetical protein